MNDKGTGKATDKEVASRAAARITIQRLPNAR